MAKRGTYAKTAARRDEILNTALNIIAQNGYSKTSLKEVADAVGLSQMGVLHHFGSKEELLTAVLKRRDALSMDGHELSAEENLAAISQYMLAHNDHVDVAFQEVARQNTKTPGLIQLFSRLLTEASEPDHKAHNYFKERIETLRAFVIVTLKQERESGYISSDLDIEKAATSFIALMDGLQTLWLYDDSINVAAHIEFFWNQITTASREN